MASTPYSGSSIQRLFDMLNADNKTSFTPNTEFTLGAPTSSGVTNGRNTLVVFTPVDTKFNPISIQYWRLPLTVLNGLDDKLPPLNLPAFPFTTADVIDAFSAQYGIVLEVDEVVAQTYTQQSDSYPLRIDESKSYAWLDSDFRFEATFPVTPDGPASNDAVHMRVDWFDGFSLEPNSYLPISFGGQTFTAPLGSIPKSIPPSASPWRRMNYNPDADSGSVEVPSKGVILDLAVLDFVKNQIAERQPVTWTAQLSTPVQTILVLTASQVEGSTFKSVLDDVQYPVLGITLPDDLSVGRVSIIVTGTYANGSTIQGSVDALRIS